MKKKITVFIDSGDTIVDESTEIRNSNDIVTEAGVIEGADALLRTLKEKGYRVALVADGYAESFENIYRFLGLEDCFEQRIISSDLGVCKPHPKMFETALEKMGLSRKDCGNIVMVGNNLERDVAGANGMGIISVFLDWTPRYPHTPKNEAEIPRHIIHKPLELLTLLETLENADG